MLSTVSFHPFISHFPAALLLAGLALTYLAHKKDSSKYRAAANFNFSMGFLAAVLAVFSGLLSTDLNLKTTLEVEGHQGYSFLFTVLLGFCTGYSYTRPYSRTALWYYTFASIALLACIYSGYSLVFIS